MLEIDRLIAMSKIELMNDVGLHHTPCVKKSKEQMEQQKCKSEPRPNEEKSVMYRRRATSSDTVAAKQSLQILANLRQQKANKESENEIDSSGAGASMRSSSSDAKLKMAAKRRSKESGNNK
jgi:hypothetical protein